MKIEISNIINQLKKGSSKEKENAFKILVNEYKQRLYWHIRKIVIDHDDANDVIQNTFMKVYLKINTFNEKSKIFTWIYRIATNESINFINSKAAKIGINKSDWIEAKTSGLFADSYFDGNQASIKLQKEISKLPEKQRLVFNMKYYDKMKYKEISEILGTSIGSLKASYHHAVHKIKTNLYE